MLSKANFKNNIISNILTPMPPKKIITILLGLTFILISIFLILKNIQPSQPLQTAKSLNHYTNKVYGISFSYPNEYTLKENLVSENKDDGHYSIVLTHIKDAPLPVNGEGPTAITIDIYKNNLGKQNVSEWILNSRNSNFALSTSGLASTTLGTLPAYSYRWSGLYEGTTVVTANTDWIYAYTVTYLEMGSQIIQDFVTIKESTEITKR